MWGLSAHHGRAYRLPVPKTVRLPASLDGAEFRAFSMDVGQPVREGQPLASFSVDGKVVAMPSSASGTLRRPLISESIKCSVGDPIALVGAPEEVIGYDPEQMECVRLLLLHKCTECGNDHPVNGLVESARCTRCGDVQHLTTRFWRDSVREDVGNARKPGARGGGVTLGGPTVECRGVPPLCRKCFTLLGMDALGAAWHDTQQGRRATLHCTECGQEHAARMPPDWALEIFDGITFLVGEVTGDPAPEGPKPVIFKCPSCLAALEIAGEKRIVRCRYCESDVYLPDDLWLHLNPAAKRAHWWMLFDPKRRMKRRRS
jgi:DNA-directed RNA polymerase subunit RPC12/RpoP